MRKILTLCLAASALTSCLAQDPAMIVDKSDQFYGSRIAAKKHKMVLAQPIDSTYQFDNTVKVKELPSLSEEKAKSESQYQAVRAEESQPRVMHNGFSNEDLTADHKPKSASVKPQDYRFKISKPIARSGFTWPVQGKVISRYGKKGNKFNEGINIAAPAGTIVNAAASGKVIYIGKDIEGYGNLVIIKHNDGNIMSAYAHLQDILVTKGAKVSGREGIGTIGRTGSVSEPQLHFSMRKNKKTIDPEKAA